MKKIILILSLIILSISGYSQNGGQVIVKVLSGIQKAITGDSTAPNRISLSVKDSMCLAILDSIKLHQGDSLKIKYTPATSITVTGGLDNTDSLHLAQLNNNSDTIKKYQATPVMENDALSATNKGSVLLGRNELSGTYNAPTIVSDIALSNNSFPFIGYNYNLGSYNTLSLNADYDLLVNDEKLQTLITNTTTTRTTSNATSVNTNIIATTDLSDGSLPFKSWVFTFYGTWAGGVQFQGSNDTTIGWDRIQSINIKSLKNSSWVDSIISNGSYAVLPYYKYFRVRCTSYTSGTITSKCIVYKQNINYPFPQNDSIKVYATSGFGGSSVKIQDSSGYYIKSTANALNVNISSGSIANTSFAATQSGTWNVNNTPSASDSNKYRFLIGVQNMYAVLASDSTKYRGTLQISNFPTTYSVTGTVTTTPPSNASTNIAQINGITPLMGNGVTGTGSPRVTIASDNTAFTVNAAESGTWNITNVSGTISLPTLAATSTKQSDGSQKTQIVDGSGNVNSMTSNALDINIKSGNNTQYAELNTTNPATGNVMLGRYLSTPPTLTNAQLSTPMLSARGVMLTDGSAITQPVSFTRLKSTTDTVAITGSITAASGATSIYDSTWSSINLDTTGLGAMASSQTVGWRSDTVGLYWRKCTDMRVFFKISTANTAGANDKAVYLYACSVYTTDGGTTFYTTDQGSGTLPTLTHGSTTIVLPNDMKLLGVLSYSTQQMVLQGGFNLSSAFGNELPDKVIFIIINYSGAALATSGHIINCQPRTRVQR